MATVDEKMTALADEIRDKVGGTDKLSLDDMAVAIPAVYEAGERKHIMRYTTAFLTGNGTNVMRFDCPFEPDFVSVTAKGAEGYATPMSMLIFCLNFREFARLGGHYRYVNEESKVIQGSISSATCKNYFHYADGVCEVILPIVLGDISYLTDVQYVCVAVKYTDKSDRELLEEEIMLLSDTGAALSYSKARVNETVSDEEWQTLIARKPNRTFTLS